MLSTVSAREGWGRRPPFLRQEASRGGGKQPPSHAPTDDRDSRSPSGDSLGRASAPRPRSRHGGGARRGKRPLIGCGSQGAAPLLGRGAVWRASARGGEGALEAAGNRAAGRREGASARAGGRGATQWAWPRGSAFGPSPRAAASTAGGRGAGAPLHPHPRRSSAQGERRLAGAGGRAQRRGPAMATTSSTTGSTLLQPLSNAVQLPIDQVPASGASCPGRPCRLWCHPGGSRVGAGTGAAVPGSRRGGGAQLALSLRLSL